MSIPTPISGDYSLYVHIPFCHKKCPYCDFYVLPNREELKEAWVKGILLEIALILPKVDRRLISLYFGGGTPSLIGPHRLEKVFQALEKEILPTTEITLEVNPESAGEIAAYKALGVNRVSLGVQSLIDDELILLGRGHKSSLALSALDTIYQAGIENISIDLMMELPHQTLLTFEKSLKKAADLPITHLSLYNLTFEPKTPFFYKRALLESALAPPDERVEMFLLAEKVFNDAGLFRYEISAFAKPGGYSRHNVGYWTNRPFWGLGPSAFSMIHSARFQNVRDQKKWLSALMEGRSPVDFYEKLDDESFTREQLALSLRLTQGVEETPKLLEMCKLPLSQGLLEREEGRIRLTKKGVLLYDEVATSII